MADTKIETPNTAIAPFKPVSSLVRHDPGTKEDLQYRTDAEDMMAVLVAAETNPTAIVNWRGVATSVKNLASAWRKATYQAEAKRLHSKAR